MELSVFGILGIIFGCIFVPRFSLAIIMFSTGHPVLGVLFIIIAILIGLAGSSS